MQNVYSFTRTGTAEDDEAALRQEAVDAAHRALTHGSDGLRTFPLFLAECFERRVWEYERVFAGGTRQAPIAFHAFVHEPYPTGLGATYDTIERLIRGDVNLVDAWTKLTQRPVGLNQHAEGFDNVQLLPDPPTGNSVAAGLRRLTKEAEAGNEAAATELAAVKAGNKTVNAAMVNLGYRPPRIDRDVRDRAAQALAERIVANLPGDELDAAKADAFACGARALGIALANLIGGSIMDRRHG